jgi:DNA-binding NarL/FixJ family response regulator
LLKEFPGSAVESCEGGSHVLAKAVPLRTGRVMRWQLASRQTRTRYPKPWLRARFRAATPDLADEHKSGSISHYTATLQGDILESSDTCAKFASPMKRLVIVADNSLIVEAVRVGLRHNGEFDLVGRARPAKTSASTIVGVRPDVVLLDDMYRSMGVVELLRELRSEGQHLSLIVLSVEMNRDWLEHLFDAGATGVISKSTHPVALATLVRETLNGHIFISSSAAAPLITKRAPIQRRSPAHEG